MHAKFQVSSFTGVGEEWGDGRMRYKQSGVWHLPVLDHLML